LTEAVLTIAPSPCSTIGARAARVARTAAKKFILRGPLELVVAEKALQAQPDGTDAADQHVDAVLLIDRALGQPRGPSGAARSSATAVTLGAAEGLAPASARDDVRCFVEQRSRDASPMPNRDAGFHGHGERHRRQLRHRRRPHQDNLATTSQGSTDR
jgi:hypothetical protein